MTPSQASPLGSMPLAWGQLRHLCDQPGPPCLVGTPVYEARLVQKQMGSGWL